MRDDIFVHKIIEIVDPQFALSAPEVIKLVEEKFTPTNIDYAKCADDILKLELADEIINKHGCLVAILKRHFA